VRSADWLTERFGLPGPASLVGPVDRGLQGQIWKLACGRRTYAVKETTTPLDHDQVVAAYTLQTQAAGHGVGAPRQLLTVDGDPAAYVDGETLRVFDWVDLSAPSRALDPGAVGRLLAALHQAGVSTDDPVDPWYVEPVGRDRWVELIAELQLAGAPFAAALAALGEELVRSESIMEPARQVITSHRDLWADNLRSDPDGRLTVIDWDNCGPASAPGELAMALVEFGTGPARARDLYRAYRSAGGPAEVTGPGDFTMPIAVLHHLVELGARQWLAAGGELARQHAADRVREFTDDPFRLSDARRLLAAR